uniref:Uncharacterized protein n=1 Tax=Entomoneis paludosa TaxID=265537 RepID=A0A7S2YNJ0_9STRA
MNTASRMETKGQANKIQISQETADLLTENGKGHWIQQRKDLIVAKGKGQMQTYWLDLKTDDNAKSTTSGSTNNEQTDVAHKQSSVVERVQQKQASHVERGLETKATRLVNWNVQILWKLLQQMHSNRVVFGTSPDSEIKIESLQDNLMQSKIVPIKEYSDCIDFSAVSGSNSSSTSAQTQLPEMYKEELQKYIQSLATMYRDHPFHCFEHASHKMMALMKFFSRIVHMQANRGAAGDANAERYLAVIADPAIQFTVALASLAGGVDHAGVPNSQLVKEKSSLAVLYGNQCVSEQHALELAWSLLMGPEYGGLRRSIYVNEAEFKTFRQLFVHSVLSSDTMDKEMQGNRQRRWDELFSEGVPIWTGETLVNRKCTLILECISQAAEFAHAMQHYQLFQKWDKLLFQEAFKAFGDNRGDYDPSQFWYDAEIGFFDYMVIPLTKKLKESGVFGNSSDEYLEYALKNRREWILKGKEVIESMSKSAAGPKDAAAAGVSETPPAAKNTEVSEELKVEGSLA